MFDSIIMPFNDLFDRIKLSLARAKVAWPIAPAFPRFRATLLVLWLVSLCGLSYGHIVGPSSGRTVSLVLTLLGWSGAVLIALLKDPKVHFRIMVGQSLSLVLTLVFVLLLIASYSVFFTMPEVLSTIKVTWFVGIFLIGYFVLRFLFRAFRQSSDIPYYPGRISSALLLVVLLINIGWWFGVPIIRQFLA